jgi:hypothetical protein
MFCELIVCKVTLSLGFMMAIVHLVFVTRGVLFGGCGKHQWEIHMDTMISDPALQVRWPRCSR